MNYCGAFGPVTFTAGVSDKAKRDRGKWCNWRNCIHLEMVKDEGPQGPFMYPKCEKGHIVETVRGSNLGRLLRGKHVKCGDYQESLRLMQQQLVKREDLRELKFSEEEIFKICGPEIVW